MLPPPYELLRGWVDKLNDSLPIKRKYTIRNGVDDYFTLAGNLAKL